MKINLNKMTTESRNPASGNIDLLSTLGILKVINEEDKKVPLAIEKILPEIAKTVDLITNAFMNGGRLIYCGAGTSGRIGILDASECPPTYGTNPEMVIGLIAGGQQAILKAIENAEDSKELAENDLKNLNLNEKDIVVGIAASGRTPYVIGALEYTKSKNAKAISISCNENSPITEIADIAITPIVGSEVVTGSSRMKAGTAQKLILNMLTTASMIKIGKVYGNLMVDVEATNAKLIERQVKIVMEATDCERNIAEKALSECNRHCKTAIVMILLNLPALQAKALLDKNHGFIRAALNEGEK